MKTDYTSPVFRGKVSRLRIPPEDLEKFKLSIVSYTKNLIIRKV